MKKILLVFLMILLVLPVNCMAASGYNVYADDVAAKKGETITIPVKLKKNNGIMGFRVAVKYSEDVFESPSVKKGTITQEGIINDSITDKTKKSFDVLWSNTENVYEDGVLFYVEIKVKDSALAGKHTIKLSFNQDDTFNEEMKDVKLTCNDFDVEIIGQNEQILDEEKSFFERVYQFFIDIYKWLLNLFV